MTNLFISSYSIGSKTSSVGSYPRLKIYGMKTRFWFVRTIEHSPSRKEPNFVVGNVPEVPVQLFCQFVARWLCYLDQILYKIAPLRPSLNPVAKQKKLLKPLKSRDKYFQNFNLEDFFFEKFLFRPHFNQIEHGIIFWL